MSGPTLRHGKPGLPFAVPALVALASLLVLAQSARAEIYKCVSKEGRVTFQDSPCIGTTGTTVDIRPANSGVVVMRPANAPPPKPAPKVEPEPANAAATTDRPTQAQRDAASLKTLETDRKRRTIDFEINEAESSLDSLKSTMDRDLAGLRARKETLTNSVPGSVLETGATTELLIASERYQSQIRATQDRLADLKKARDDLTAAAAAASAKPDVRAGAPGAPGAAGAKQ